MIKMTTAITQRKVKENISMKIDCTFYYKQNCLKTCFEKFIKTLDINGIYCIKFIWSHLC